MIQLTDDAISPEQHKIAIDILKDEFEERFTDLQTHYQEQIQRVKLIAILSLGFSMIFCSIAAFMVHQLG